MVESNVSLEYLGGFFDGEGCIGAYRLPTGVRVRCAVANTVKDAVVVFLNRFGGKIRERKYEKHPKWKKLWMWETDFRDAESFLKEILPYLVVKQTQAKIALELLKAIPVRSKVGTRKASYHRNSPEDRIKLARNMIARDVMVDYLHALNTRGTNNAMGELLKEVDLSCCELSMSPSDTQYDIAMRQMAAIAVHRALGGCAVS